MKIPVKKHNYKIKEPYIACSYIWPVNITTCVHLLDTQSVNVTILQIHEWSLIMYKNFQKKKKTKEAVHNFQSHLA